MAMGYRQPFAAIERGIDVLERVATGRPARCVDGIPGGARGPRRTPGSGLGRDLPREAQGRARDGRLAGRCGRGLPPAPADTP